MDPKDFNFGESSPAVPHFERPPHNDNDNDEDEDKHSSLYHPQSSRDEEEEQEGSIDPEIQINVPQPDSSLKEDLQRLTQLVGSFIIAQGKETPPTQPQKSDVKLTIMSYGGEPHKNLELFLWQCEVVFKAKNVPDTLRVVTVLPQLKGKAAKHLQSLGSQVMAMKWVDFKEKMKQAFTSRQEKTQALLALTQLRQTKDLLSYSTEFLTYSNKVTLDEENKVIYFLNGLKSKTQAEVRCKDPSTLDKAIDLASKFEGAMFGALNMTYQDKEKSQSLYSKSTPSKGSYSKYSRRPVFKREEEKSQDKRVTQQTERSLQWDQEGKPICFRCGRTGHLGKECQAQRSSQGKGINPPPKPLN